MTDIKPRDKVIRDRDGFIVECIYDYSPAEYMMPPTEYAVDASYFDGIKSIPVCGLHAAAIRTENAITKQQKEL
jgi:hypothetical protein